MAASVKASTYLNQASEPFDYSEILGTRGGGGGGGVTATIDLAA